MRQFEKLDLSLWHFPINSLALPDFIGFHFEKDIIVVLGDFNFIFEMLDGIFLFGLVVFDDNGSFLQLYVCNKSTILLRFLYVERGEKEGHNFGILEGARLLVEGLYKIDGGLML